MSKFLFLISCSILIFANCSTNQPDDAGQPVADSLSKAQQRAHADSLKGRNPLLILPPDSDYTGDYIDKYDNGVIKFKGQYRFGQRHGQWMSFYPNGLAWSELHYDKGLREGSNITYFLSGEVRYKGFYKNDKQDSIWCYYDSIGNLAAKVLYKNDVLLERLPLK